jgi:uncharacterized protein YjiS (DUF1127 family)
MDSAWEVDVEQYRKSTSSVGILTSSLLGSLKRLYLRHRQRQLLLSLGDDALKDIGLSRVDALAEGGKPFWQN